MALYLRYAVRSDLGLVRTNNEDSVYAGPRLLAIADGMGGHAAGEVASKIVIGTLEPLDEDRRIDDLMGALRDAVIEANQGIADAVSQRAELEGMGTTLTALRFVGSQVGLVHVGDSRAYLLRNNLLSQITHDDTYVQFLVDSGKLTPDEAKDHPRKSVILRALLGADVEPDVSIREARQGDRYLLCSDGLSDVVSTETILDTLRIEDPQEAADRLVELALRGGGPDNVTVIVSDVVNAKVGDVIDDVPVVSGAFVDPAAADVPGNEPGSDSAAERAAKMARAQPSEADAAGSAEPAQPKRRFRWKPWVTGFAIVAVLVAALGGIYAWTQTQFFVGANGRDSEVAIFRGVNTEFGPLKFFSVYQNTGLRIAVLKPVVQSQVRSGITANNVSDAQRIVRDLNSKDNQLPRCRTVPPSPTESPTTPTGSPTGSPTESPTSATSSPSSPSTSSDGTPGTSPRAGATSVSKRPGRPTSPGRTQQGSVSASPAPSTELGTVSVPSGSAPESEPTPRPGIDCR